MHMKAGKQGLPLQNVSRRKGVRSHSTQFAGRIDGGSPSILSRQKVRRQKLKREPSHMPKSTGAAGSALRSLLSRLTKAINGPRLGLYSLPFLILMTAAGALLMGFSGFTYGGQTETALPWPGQKTAVDLPETSAAERELLDFSSIRTEGQGSGDLRLPEKPAITNVGTDTYTVQRGDTLSEIAERHGIDVGTLIGFNGISDVRRVMAGSTLKIPNIDGVPYTVKEGDSLEKIAASFQVPLADILDANDLQSALIKPGQELFIPGGEISEYAYRRAMGTLFLYPADGRLTSGFGYRIDPFTGIRRMHYGIDLSGDVGTPVKATMEGRVAVTGNQPRGYGKYVVIKHRYGFQSLYGHLDSIEVRRGQHIAQGQRLGRMGNSGRSTGPHLHFAIYKNNAPVNPLDRYLQ